MRITYGGNRVEIPLLFRIDVNQWDKEAERALPKIKNKQGYTSKEINRHIDEYESAMKETFARFEMVEKRLPDPEELKAVFSGLAGRKQKKTTPDNVLFRMDEFLTEGAKTWADGTIKKFKTFRTYISEYKSDFTYNDITENFINGFLDFLIEKKNYSNVSVKKYHRMLAWFLNWSTKKKYNTNLAYKDYKPKYKTIDKKLVFFTWDELMTLYEFKIPEEKAYLEKVRDVVCFCCFSSLRFSDVFGLKKHDITENSINVVTVKTTDPLVIDLNKYSKAILDKYKDFHFENGKALPVISHQKTNDYLKELGKLAEIDTPTTVTYMKGRERITETYPKHQLLSTHIGRRTFICNALALGIPAHVVMEWTGHSDYEAMAPYIAVADQTKAVEMTKFDTKQ